MKFKIKSDSLFETCRLDIGPDYCSYLKGMVAMGNVNIGYRNIDLILLNDKKELSIHYGDKIFNIKTKPKHQKAVEYLLERVRQAHLGRE